jgi:hypothetical protein
MIVLSRAYTYGSWAGVVPSPSTRPPSPRTLIDFEEVWIHFSWALPVLDALPQRVGGTTRLISSSEQPLLRATSVRGLWVACLCRRRSNRFRHQHHCHHCTQ